MTDVLYRYQSMAHPKAVGYTLDILESERLYCPAPALFNDPFECQATLSFEAPVEIKTPHAKRHLLRDNPGMPDEKADARAPEYWREMEERGPQAFFDHLQHGIGVASFAGKADDILMWSHYAGSHNGICLKFHATEPGHVDFLARAQEVHYQEDFPSVNFYTADLREKVRVYVLTKAEHWRYEDEWRIVLDTQHEGRFLKLPKRILSAVLLGARITDENRRLIVDRIASRAVAGELRVFQAHVAPGAYRLEFAKGEPVPK